MKKIQFGNTEKLMSRENLNAYLNDTRMRKNSENMVEKNLLLVVSIAKHYVPILPLEDLIQEGNIGLMVAAERWEHGKGAFSTFATPYIRKHMLQAIENDSRLVRRPHHGQDGFVWDTSLDEPIRDNDGNSTTRADQLSSGLTSDNLTTKSDISIIISTCLDRLTERERAIVTMYYGIGSDLPMSYDSIGEELELTSERVRQLHALALRKMRGENVNKH